jgi:mannose-6-phosphate isomerase-like protein (cupin superfamily)
VAAVGVDDVLAVPASSSHTIDQEAALPMTGFKVQLP